MRLPAVLRRPLKAVVQGILERSYFGLEHPYRVAYLLRRLMGRSTVQAQRIQGYQDPRFITNRTIQHYVAKWSDPEAKQRIALRQQLVLDGLRTEKIIPASWLEVGCGPGWNLDFFQRHYPLSRFTGIDVAPEQLQGARELGFVQHGVNFVQGNMFSLPFADGAFELVYTFMVLGHVSPSRVTDVLREVLRVSSRYVLHLEPTWNYRPEALGGVALFEDDVFFHDLRKRYQRRFGCRVIAETYRRQARVGGWDHVVLLMEKPDANPGSRSSAQPALLEASPPGWGDRPSESAA